MKLIFLAMMLVGLGLSIWLVVQLTTGLRSLNWPSVVGEIILKDIDESVRRTLRHPNRYVYRYNVRGIDYFSQRVTVSDAFIPKAGMVSRVLDKHPDGAMITVYYQRQNPQSSLLERGPRRETVIYLILAFLLLGMSMYGYIRFD